MSNVPTEAVNILIERVMRFAYGFTSFQSYGVRSRLYAGKPSGNLLATVTHR